MVRYRIRNKYCYSKRSCDEGLPLRLHVVMYIRGRRVGSTRNSYCNVVLIFVHDVSINKRKAVPRVPAKM